MHYGLRAEGVVLWSIAGSDKGEAMKVRLAGFFCHSSLP